MTVKEAIANATTKHVLVTKGGKILRANEKVNSEYDENATVKKIRVFNDEWTDSPVITAIRV